MKFATFLHNDEERLGVLTGAHCIDLVGASKSDSEKRLFSSALTLIRAADEGRQVAERIVADAPSDARLETEKVTLTAPIRPTTILCTGSNYRQHNEEKANTAISGKEPEFFIKTSDCVIGTGESIIYDPALTEKLDCETELAIVIGKPGRHIPLESALDHVFGYTIGNDVTARDRQVRKTPSGDIWYDLGRGKAFDTSAPLGPSIVSADEIGDPQNLKLQTRINGELRQSSNTSDMIWSCAELVHFFSVSFNLKPGMVIITGTPAGTCWSTDTSLGGTWQALPGLTPATRYCLPGDVVESEIEKIGTLRNPIVHV